MKIETTCAAVKCDVVVKSMRKIINDNTHDDEWYTQLDKQHQHNFVNDHNSDTWNIKYRDDGDTPWMAEMAGPEEIEAAFRDSVRTIITPEGWKFNLSPLGEHELYNLRKDPQETENLAPNPEYASLMEQLTEQIREWQAETGDT